MQSGFNDKSGGTYEKCAVNVFSSLCMTSKSQTILEHELMTSAYSSK
jgi:hypothetical protein